MAVRADLKSAMRASSSALLLRNRLANHVVAAAISSRMLRTEVLRDVDKQSGLGLIELWRAFAFCAFVTSDTCAQAVWIPGWVLQLILNGAAKISKNEIQWKTGFLQRWSKEARCLTKWASVERCCGPCCVYCCASLSLPPLPKRGSWQTLRKRRSSPLLLMSPLPPSSLTSPQKVRKYFHFDHSQWSKTSCHAFVFRVLCGRACWNSIRVCQQWRRIPRHHARHCLLQLPTRLLLLHSKCMYSPTFAVVAVHNSLTTNPLY